MEIKIAKIKVTKAIINQFQHPSLEVLQTANVLGFVCNVVKGQYKTLILENNGSYYKIEIQDWYLDNDGFEVRVGRMFQPFKQYGKAEEWLTAYNRCKNAEAASVQLFV